MSDAAYGSLSSRFGSGVGAMSKAVSNQTSSIVGLVTIPSQLIYSISPASSGSIGSVPQSTVALSLPMSNSSNTHILSSSGSAHNSSVGSAPSSTSFSLGASMIGNVTVISKGPFCLTKVTKMGS